jgi:hypothetical protein
MNERDTMDRVDGGTGRPAPGQWAGPGATPADTGVIRPGPERADMDGLNLCAGKRGSRRKVGPILQWTQWFVKGKDRRRRG